MRLVDADVLKAEFDELITTLEIEKCKESITREEFCEILKFLRDAVDEQPTAYDVEKVVEQIHNELFCYDVPSESVEEIVRKGGV